MLTYELPHFLTPEEGNLLNSKSGEKPKFLKHICYRSVTCLIKLPGGLPVLQTKSTIWFLVFQKDLDRRSLAFCVQFNSKEFPAFADSTTGTRNLLDSAGLGSA